MRKIIIIILSFITFGVQAQSNLNGKNITAKDTLQGQFLKLATNASLPIAPIRPMIAVRNDTLFAYQNGAWKVILGSGGLSVVGNAISISGDSIQLGGPFTKDTYVGDLADYSKFLYITAKDVAIDTKGIYQFHDSSFTINAPHGAAYDYDYSTYLKTQPLSIPNTGMIRSIVSDSTRRKYDTISFKQFVPLYPDSGTVWFNNGVLNVHSDVPSVIMNVGEELWAPIIKNNTGSIIPNGTVVRISGNVGNKMTVAKASYSSKDSSGTTLGVATHDIAINGFGRITLYGSVGDLNTSAYSAGDTLYLSYSGLLRKTKPTTGYPIRIGYVEYSHVNKGRIIVSIAKMADIRPVTETTLTGFIKGNGSLISVATNADTATNSTNGLMSSWDHTKTSTTLFSGGNSVANQVPFWTNTGNKVTGNNQFTFDSTSHILNVSKNGNGITPSGGITLYNNTASTSLVVSQSSPTITLSGSEWDTDDNISRPLYARLSLTGTSGALGVTTLAFQTSNNNSTWSDNLKLTTSTSANNVSTSTFGSSLTATTLTGTSTSPNTASFSASFSNLGQIRNLGFLSTNTTAATNSAKVQNPARFILSGRNWNGSVSRVHNWDMALRGKANTEISNLSFMYSPQGDTITVPFLQLEDYYTGTTTGTGNNFYMGNGASQVSPNLSITSLGKSIAIGANASNSHIIGDNSANITLGFDSKANIDGHSPSPTTGLTIFNNDGLSYKGAIQADSQYIPKKLIYYIVNKATSGNLTNLGNYNASVNAWPTSGSGTAGAVVSGDWWTVSVKGVVNGDSLRVGYIITAKIDAPGNTNTNWNIIGSTQTQPIGRISGETGVGYVKYNGRTRTKGYLYGGYNSLNPNNGDSTLKFQGNLQAFNFNSYGASDFQATNVTPLTSRAFGVSGATGSIIYSQSGISLITNTETANTSNLAEFRRNDVAQATISSTGKLTLLGDLTYNMRHAFLNAAANYTPAVTQNIYTKILPTFTAIELMNMTFAGDTLTITTAGDYILTYTYTISGANGDDFTVQIRKNNVAVCESRQTTTATNNYQTVTMIWYFEATSVNDRISLYVTNTASNGDPTLSNQRLYIRKEHD